MARYLFGDSPADFAAGVSGNNITLSRNLLITFWDQKEPVGSGQYTDLLDVTGTEPITDYFTRSTDGGLYQFQGPDDVLEMWIDAGGPERQLITCHMAPIVAALLAAGTATLGLSGGLAWAPTTSYPVGTVFVRPSDGSTRIVSTLYTSGSVYSVGTDDFNSIQVAPGPSTFTETVADGRYAAVSGAYRQQIIDIGDILTVGLDADPNGVDMPFTGNINQFVPELLEPVIGADAVILVYQLVPSTNVEVLAQTVPVFDGHVSNIWAAQRTDTVGTTSGSPTVTDPKITAYDAGRPVSGAGIPASSYVGTAANITAGTSFKLSSSATSQVNVNATATATGVAATVGKVFSFTKDDKLFFRLEQVGSLFPGQGLKMRLMFGTETAAVVTTPGTPTGLAIIASDTESVTLGWTNGTNSSQAVLNVDNAELINLGSQTSYRYLGPDGTGMTTPSTFSIAGRRGPAISAFVSSVTGGPTSEYDILPQANGALLNPPMSVTVGTGATCSVSADILTTVSGTAGNNATADQALLEFVGDTGNYSAWGVKGLWAPQSTGTVYSLLLSSNVFNLSGTPWTNGVLLNWSTGTYKIGFKAPSFGSTAGGTGANGTYQNLTDSGYPTNQATTRATAGTISWASTLAVGTYYGFKLVQQNDSDGTQTVFFYFGTSTQYGTDGSGLPLLNTITLNTTMRSDMAAGKAYAQQAGHQPNVSGIAESSSWSKLAFTPIAA